VTSFRGQASWAKMIPPGGKLTEANSIGVPPDQKSKQSRVATYLTTSTDLN
jgi:hypothetical protein